MAGICAAAGIDPNVRKPNIAKTTKWEKERSLSAIEAILYVQPTVLTSLA